MIKLPNVKKYLFANTFAVIAYFLVASLHKMSITNYPPPTLHNWGEGDVWMESSEYMTDETTVMIFYLLDILAGLLLLIEMLLRFLLKKYFFKNGINISLLKKIKIPKFITAIHSIFFYPGFYISLFAIIYLFCK